MLSDPEEFYELREDLRERFRKEYLAMLVQKGKEKGCILEVGEVVLLETEAKRIKWPIGIIIETHRGRDGHVRAATVRTQEGAVYLRPIQRLYPLELRDANWATNNGR